MKRSIRITVALAVAAVVFAGQWFAHHFRGHRGSDPGHTHAAHYRLGRLEFTRCQLKTPQSGQTTAAWCAPFAQPENPADPGGPKITLRLALIRSAAEHPAKDLVVYLAGGPGQSAINTWPLIAPALHSVLEHRDVVLLDQRGTGGSHPLTCPQVQHAVAIEAARWDTSAAKRESRKERHARQAAQIKSCLKEVEKTADPRYFTTTDAVHDLMALRRALGEPKFDLVGVSYGTLVAQQYAMRDPTGVRSMVLDSVVPNGVILGENIPRDLHQALMADFALCTAEPACRKTIGNPATDLTELRARLKRHDPLVHYPDPITNQMRSRTLDEDVLARVVRLFAYSPITAALLPLTLHEAVKGDYVPLMAQANLISGAVLPSMDVGMALTVTCSEDAPLLKPNPANKDTLLGTRFIRNLRAECALWPKGMMPADFHQPLHSAVPTLILEGQFDPVTPPRYGRQVLAGLRDGRLLIARGQGHNVIGAGCMPHLVGKFIAHLHPKRLNARCLKALEPMPPFVSFSGATP